MTFVLFEYRRDRIPLKKTSSVLNSFLPKRFLYIGNVLIISFSGISSRRCTDLEQSSVAYRICSVISRLLLSLEDILVRTLLPVITVAVPAQ